jgi:hypothetical protein
MSPFAVADKSYVVNDRLAYESQLIHAVIEARAPLQHRLDCTYEGEGPTRACVVTGEFTSGDVRDYRSPMLKDIKVKNSPLWVADPDQQLWYYASRAWARKWCPDVLMGIYSREELAENPDLGREGAGDVDPGLHGRLTKAQAHNGEGFRDGHVDAELAQIAGGAQEGEILPPVEEGKKPKGKGKAAKEAQPAAAEEEQEAPKIVRNVACAKCGTAYAIKPNQCTNCGSVKFEAATDDSERVAEASDPTDGTSYADYARAWIAKATSADDLEARWDSERDLRAQCKVGVSLRKALERDAYDPKLKELRKAKR